MNKIIDFLQLRTTEKIQINIYNIYIPVYICHQKFGVQTIVESEREREDDADNHV